MLYSIVARMLKHLLKAVTIIAMVITVLGIVNGGFYLMNTASTVAFNVGVIVVGIIATGLVMSIVEWISSSEATINLGDDDNENDY